MLMRESPSHPRDGNWYESLKCHQYYLQVIVTVAGDNFIFSGESPLSIFEITNPDAGLAVASRGMASWNDLLNVIITNF
jgi:hypothetical protein